MLIGGASGPGTKGENCISNRNNVLISPDGRPTRTESIINSWGVFRVAITQPALGVNQVTDAEIWNKVGNLITLTWSVRDLTAEELDEQAAQPMALSDYYQWKILVLKGVVTKAELATNLPQELKDAYLARERMGE